VVCESVLKPLEEQNGGIVEVNAAPGLRMHLQPSFGKGRDVGSAIIDTMFSNGHDGRIPLIAVTGTNGKTTTVRLCAHLLRTSGLRTGMTNTDGVFVNGLQLDTGDCSGPRSARSVLMHPDVDAAVLETARGGMLREGLAFDRCQVAVVTNIGAGDHLGLNYISTVEDLAVLKRVIVQNVSPRGTAVLNAADPVVAAMAAKCKGAVIFFALDQFNPIMATHRAQGRAVVYVENQQIVAARGAENAVHAEGRFDTAQQDRATPGAWFRTGGTSRGAGLALAPSRSDRGHDAGELPCRHPRTDCCSCRESRAPFNRRLGQCGASR
jgi:cyanophycin synthetase